MKYDIVENKRGLKKVWKFTVLAAFFALALLIAVSRVKFIVS